MSELFINPLCNTNVGLSRFGNSTCRLVGTPAGSKALHPCLEPEDNHNEITFSMAIHQAVVATKAFRDSTTYNNMKTDIEHTPREQRTLSVMKKNKFSCFFNCNGEKSIPLPSAICQTQSKEIAKPVTPQSESVSEKDSDPEQAQRDKDMQKNLALLAKYFKKLYKLTNNNLRTSSNSKNRLKIPHQVGSQVVQQTGIQCFNCKGYGHYAKECRKPKRVKDYAYHKEKDDECANKLNKEVLPKESSSTEQPLEQVQNNDENNVFANERQHSENNTAKCADERVALANLISNLTLDTEENKTILKQLKKANASLTQELEECKTNLDETSRALGRLLVCRDRLS
ncbi:gag-pol polyprotein [Tanacetum coccineum]